MSAPRLLVVEGNVAEARARQVRFGGEAASEGYARLLREILPTAVVDICYPADPGANLPDSGGLEGYDGIAITGSSLNIYNGGEEIQKQIDRWRRRAQEPARSRGRLRPPHPRHRRRARPSHV